MRYFFVDPSQLAGTRAVLEGSEASHIRNVIRLKRGDAVGLVDGTGFEYSAVIDRIMTGRVELEITARRMSAGTSALSLTVAQGFLKEKKMDLVVRQLSELGATRFIPFVCERAVARPGAGRGSFRRERWHKIAVESLKQCRRGDVMGIGEVHGFDELLARGRDHDLALFFWEDATAADPGAAGRATRTRFRLGGAGTRGRVFGEPRPGRRRRPASTASAWGRGSSRPKRPPSRPPRSFNTSSATSVPGKNILTKHEPSFRRCSLKTVFRCVPR